jgi:hypothetical protein
LVVHAEHTTGGLVERLKQAAAEVIQSQRRELERDPRELRSVVIEHGLTARHPRSSAPRTRSLGLKEA